MGEHHVEVALADRDVDGLADRATAVVQVQRLVRELDEVAEVFDRRIAPAVVEVVGERRAVVRGEHGGVATDAHVPLWVAGVLDVLPWRSGLHDLPAHAPRKAHQGAVDRGAGVGEHLQRRRVVADDHPDLLEDRVGVVLEDLETFVADDLERLHGSCQVGLGLDDVRGAQRLTAGSAPAAPASTGVGAVLGGRHDLFSCLRRRRPPLASTDELRSGRVTTAPRFGDGAVACGKAIAATNSSWNCGSVAVSILITARAAASSSARACIESSARTAPAPAAFPTDRTAVEGRVGYETEHQGVQRIDVGAERAGQAHVAQRFDTGVAHQQFDPGAQGCLGELDGAHVVLGDRQLDLVRAVQHVAEGAVVGDDVRAGRRCFAANDALRIDHTRQEHLADHFDDARAADAADRQVLGGGGEAGLVAPQIAADHLESWRQRGSVDAHPLDGTSSCSLTARDLGTLEGRAGGARRGELALRAAEHDLGIGADVDEQLPLVAAVRAFGEHRRRGVGTNVTGDARTDEDPRGRELQSEIDRSGSHRLGARQA